MPRSAVRFRQGSSTEKPLRMTPVTIASTNPLTVTLPGGAVVPGHAVTGLTYTVGGAAVVFLREPAVGPVIPIS